MSDLAELLGPGWCYEPSEEILEFVRVMARRQARLDMKGGEQERPEEKAAGKGRKQDNKPTPSTLVVEYRDEASGHLIKAETGPIRPGLSVGSDLHFFSDPQFNQGSDILGTISAAGLTGGRCSGDTIEYVFTVTVRTL